MAKQTRKFKAAMEAVRARGGQPAVSMHADGLYDRLQLQGLMWDSKAGKWVDVADELADEPSRLVRLRVWADRELVEDWAEDLVRLLEGAGWDLVDRSAVYGCRPPKQLEGRIYVQMAPPEKKVLG